MTKNKTLVIIIIKDAIKNNIKSRTPIDKAERNIKL